MVTLLLLRHAQAGWETPQTADHERTLTALGEQEARSIGQQLAKVGLTFDLVLVSTATRTRQTLELILKETKSAPRVVDTRRLYLAEPEELADVARDHSGEARRVLVVGHNPGLSVWVSELSGRHLEMRTGALAQIELPLSRLADLGPGTQGSLAAFLEPERGR